MSSSVAWVAGLAVTSFWFTGLLSAQNNEVALLGGATLTQRREIALPPVIQSVLGVDALREDNGFAAGIAYRRVLFRAGPASLLAELPVMAVQATNTDLLPLIARPFFGSTSGVSVFITPGAVVQFLPDAPLRPFVFFGAGYARVVEAQLTSTNPFRGDFVDQGTWALSYGGGLDVRVVRWFGFRGELRNFYTGSTQPPITLPEETRQRNTLILSGGLLFRFEPDI